MLAGWVPERWDAGAYGNNAAGGEGVERAPGRWWGRGRRWRAVWRGGGNGNCDVACGRAPPLRSGSGCARRRQRYNCCQRRRAPCARGQRYCCCPRAPGSRPCGRASLTQRRPVRRLPRGPHPPAPSPVHHLSAPSIACPVRERGRPSLTGRELPACSKVSPSPRGTSGEGAGGGAPRRCTVPAPVPRDRPNDDGPIPASGAGPVGRSQPGDGLSPPRRRPLPRR